MSVSYGFYNSVNGDRKYDAKQISSIFDGLIGDGIYQSIGTAMAVKANGGMNIKVGQGRAWFNHTWTLVDAEELLTIDPSEVLYDRIDAVILEINATDDVRKNAIKILKGTPGDPASRPQLTNTSVIHQYPLAYITVKKGVVELTQSSITNMIGTSSTPYVTGIIKTVNIDNMIAQWETEWDEWVEATKTENTSWTTQQRNAWTAWVTVQENEFTTWKTEYIAEMEAIKDEIVEYQENAEATFENWFAGIKKRYEDGMVPEHTHSTSDITDGVLVTDLLPIIPIEKGGTGVTTIDEIFTQLGITATPTELNYIKGVTSAVQTQLNAKAPIANPTFTGTPKAPTAANGTNSTQLATTAFVNAAIPLISGQNVLVDKSFTSASSFSLTGLNLTHYKRYKLLLTVEAGATELSAIDLRFNEYTDEQYSWTSHLFDANGVTSSSSYQSSSTYIKIGDKVPVNDIAFIEVDFMFDATVEDATGLNRRQRATAIFKSSFFSKTYRGVGYGWYDHYDYAMEPDMTPVTSIKIYSSNTIAKLYVRLLEV